MSETNAICKVDSLTRDSPPPGSFQINQQTSGRPEYARDHAHAIQQPGLRRIKMADRHERQKSQHDHDRQRQRNRRSGNT